jgi:hypothetical protein
MTFRFIKIWVLLLCGFLAVATFAQNSNSTIKGTVQDASGAVVPGATVDLTNVGTGQTLSTTSKGDGFYTFTNLSPANYKISVKTQGFAEYLGVLTLRVSQDAEINPRLTAASVSTKVTVQDVTPVIDRVNPTLSDVKNSTQIETLPVQNRSILSVLAFSPGVVSGNYGDAGAGFTRANGVPGGSVDFRVDGQTMNNAFSGSLQSTPQSTMTFQEVKILTSNGDAQYSRPGVVELVTKSGTNQFHGQAFELNQNNHLQARTFGSGPTIPFLQHNEWGAQLGGPVWVPKIYNGRNKTFFFVDFEWFQDNKNAVVQARVPTAAETGGDLSQLLGASQNNGEPGPAITIYDPNSTVYDPATDAYTRTPFPGNIIPTNRLNPVIQKFFGNIKVPGLVPYPQPNIPGADISQFIPNYIPPSAKSTTRQKNYTAKVDQLFGPNRLAMRYTYTNENQVRPNSYYLLQPNALQAGGHNGALVFTQVLGARAVNVVRAGVQYNHNFSGPVPLPGVTEKIGLPDYTNTIGWPQLIWSYGYVATDTYWTDLQINNPKDYPDATITAGDQFSYNRGNHQLMFGFDFNNSRLTTYETGQPGGTYAFDGGFTAEQVPGVGNEGTSLPNTGSGLADMLLGDSGGLFINFYPVYHTRQTEYSGFAQDNWRVTQKLTLNLGLRYEYWTPFNDASGRYSTFNPNPAGGQIVYQGSGLPAYTSQALYSQFQQSFASVGTSIVSAAAAHYPTGLLTVPKTNFEPRAGFAYQLDNKTTLRGGYGIYHFIIPLQQFEQAVRKNPPFSYSATLQPGEVNGQSTNLFAAEMEFPIASSAFGGQQPLNQFMIGNQANCTPATLCNPPGFVVDDTNAITAPPGSGYAFQALSPNYKPSMVQEYNLTFSRELPWNTGFQLSYIGNHTNNLLMQDPINYLVPRLSCAAANAPDLAACQSGTSSARRSYPAYATSNAGAQDIDYYNGYANSNELQAQVQHTFGNSLLLQAYYTWGHFLTTSEAGLLGGGSPGSSEPAQTMIPASETTGYSLANPTTTGASMSDRVRAEYSNDPTLPRNTFQLAAHYQLPFGKGQRFLGDSHGIVNALVSGYNVSSFFLWHSGFYFSPYATQFSGSSVGSGGKGILLAPGKTGILPNNQRTASKWFDYSVWDPSSGNPYAGQTYEYTATSQLGDYRNNIPFNYITGPGFNNMDANIYKLTPLYRNLVFDFEAQVFNIYNHQNLGLPNGTGVITASLPNALPRTIQLQAKIIF